jgi:hypothetical protein
MHKQNYIKRKRHPSQTPYEDFKAILAENQKLLPAIFPRSVFLFQTVLLWLPATKLCYFAPIQKTASAPTFFVNSNPDHSTQIRLRLICTGGTWRWDRVEGDMHDRGTVVSFCARERVYLFPKTSTSVPEPAQPLFNG